MICPGTGSNSCDWDNVTQALAHLDKVIEQVKLLDADILALEEVEDCDTLRNISAFVPDMHYQAYMHESKDTYIYSICSIRTTVPVDSSRFSLVRRSGFDVILSSLYAS